MLICLQGRIKYAYQKEEADFLCQRLLTSGITTLGFDIEWRVTFTVGVSASNTLREAIAHQCLVRARELGIIKCTAWKAKCQFGFAARLADALLGLAASTQGSAPAAVLLSARPPGL